MRRDHKERHGTLRQSPQGRGRRREVAARSTGRAQRGDEEIPFISSRSALLPTRQAAFVCAHGAGGHRDDRGMLALAKALGAHGFDVIRFNFPYREKGSSRPDPMPVLKRTIAEVAEGVREDRKPARLFIGGRSMGGRAASMLAADGFECDGLLLFAYPLHPAGRPDKLRDAHLPKIKVPVLCFSGTRDALCRRDLMERAVAGVPGWTMRWLEGADHSFRVLKSSGRTETEVLEGIGETSQRWLLAIL